MSRTGIGPASTRRMFDTPLAGDLRARVGAMTRTCPDCGAAPGVSCFSLNAAAYARKIKRPHNSRRGWVAKAATP